MSTYAVIIPATLKRLNLIRQSVAAWITEAPDEILVVGDFEPGQGYRYLPLPPLTSTTLDALVKRDVGALATKADWLIYCADDHMPKPGFMAHARTLQRMSVDVWVPHREVHVGGGSTIQLNMGWPDYCGGHGGMFKRELVEKMPWCTMAHHPNWDLIDSKLQMDAGAHFEEAPGLVIQDIEPGAEPWK